MKEFDTSAEPSWCPGCGDFGIQAALKNAFSELKLKKEEIVMVTGIGCGSKITHWIDTYGIHSIHGRSIPIATGVKLANHKLKVIAVGGDGDGYGIGLNHFMQIQRRNVNITYIVQNNQIYGLTKGQTSPTSEKGYESHTTPHGNLEEPVNPMSIAIAGGASFVARGYVAHLRHLTDLIKQAIMHEGFSFVDVFQPCVTWNKHNTYGYFKTRVYELESANYKPINKVKAYEKSLEMEEKIPIGLFYKEDKPTYESGLKQIKKTPLVKQDISKIDITRTLENHY